MSKKETGPWTIQGSIMKIIALPSEKAFLTAGIDSSKDEFPGVLRLWDITTGEILREYPRVAAGLVDAAVTSDCSIAIAAGGAIVSIWDIENNMLKSSFQFEDIANISSVAIDPMGKFVAVSCYGGVMNVFSISDGTVFRKIDLPGYAASSIFSPEGTHLYISEKFGSIQIIRLSDGTCERKFIGTREYNECRISLSCDGKLIAAGDREGRLTIHNSTDGTILHQLDGHSQWILGLAFSPDGRYLASGAEDRKILIWEVSSGQRIKTLRQPYSQIISLAFTMDGKHLLSGSRDGMIGLWDVESGTLLNAEAHKERQELERKRLAKMEIKAREKDPKARYKYALQLGNLSIYEAFLWFSLAEDAGSKSAAASLEALIETGEISTECVVLAYFQLGKWYETGTIIEADSAKSMEYFTQCALKAGLPGFTTVDELAKKLGLPDNLDFSQPLRSA